MASFFRSGKKCVAIGRNYMNHVKELGNTAPKEPFFFLKPTTSYLANNGVVELPRGIDVHHEVELGVVIGKKGRDVSESDAMKYIAGYTLAIDMTARNLQEVVKKKGLPWSAVKGFDTFCPVSDFLPASEVQDPHNLRLWLKINEKTTQDGMTSDMVFRIPRLINHVSSIMTLEEGDLLLTGTPEGVGPVKNGDKLLAALETADGKQLLKWAGTAKDRVGGYKFEQ
ncbi:hypothetical protein P389DRAFT_78282 [Cystobasidium minutum MCA 4210]|uniref:uncharacterized protein n=1 Tax=Cystobasidium minutum MCA 4210 TaxID=1397322 RepID=UPI0034CED2A5|eukprot:jgi/Rhomi1/78282/CE78281_1124